MKEALFLLADLWMIFVGYFYGWKLIRRYGNYLLGLEWMVVATSGSNFLLWSLLGGDSGSVLYDVAYFFDAFSRSVGIT
ncbi:transporter, partial [Streptomyces sp. SID7760]|nr:transporter [Streptomyces sp. SID7760]